MILLVAALVLVGGPVLLYFLVQNGTITQRQLLTAIGQGPGETSVMNLTEGEVTVSIQSLEEGMQGGGSQDSLFGSQSLTLAPMDINGFANLRPGRYRLSLTYADGGSATRTCNMKIGSGDLYTFIAVPEGVGVYNEKEPAQNAGDLNVETSPLCQR